MVGNQGRGFGQGELGDGACPIAGINPLLDGDAVESVTRLDDNRVGHNLEGDRAPEIVWELERHFFESWSLFQSEGRDKLWRREREREREKRVYKIPAEGERERERERERGSSCCGP